jgi:Ni,Fe-hydrogenase maturation factor
MIIGIQPGRLDFASDISKEVKQAIKQVSTEIEEALP